MENSFFCPRSDSEEVVYLIRRQKNIFTDLMNIPVFISRILAPLIYPPISMLFNNSLSEGIFLECFKIIQFYKCEDKISTVDDRNISMWTFLSKLKKMICASLLD